MAYSLQALIAKSGALSGAALPEALVLVPLQGGIDMIPLGANALKVQGLPFLPLTDEGQTGLPSSLLALCRQLSEHCALAYVEAEIFGGSGTQAHVLFAKAEGVGESVVSESAINDALRFLGVSKGAAIDEFEAVGLGQHRQTEDWLA